MKQFLSQNRIFLLLLLIYHLILMMVSYEYVLENNGDAKRYWFLGQNLANNSWSDFLRPGTDVVKVSTFPFVKYLHFPFWAGFLLFSLISFIGLVLLYRLLSEISGNNSILRCLAMGLMLLPNLHFWTTIIGKEALIFPLLIFLLTEIYRKKYFSFLLLLSIIFIALIRPHIAFVLVLSYAVSLLFTQQISLKRKTILGGIFILLNGLFILILSQLQDFSGGIPRIVKKYEAHIQYFKKTDAYVPLDEYQLPYKIFTFYFRPLPFEKEGLFYQIISIENTVLLMFFSISLYYAVKYFGLLKKRILFVFPLLMLFFFAAMYVYAYANYGIIMRTKIMVIPFMYLLILEVIAVAFSQKNPLNDNPVSKLRE